ncbi:MAG TPA: hypothetical protein VF466_02545 [Candidatus Saccharimonadales bacterium]
MDKLGIVFSGRVRSALLCVLALWILLVLGSSSFQIFSSYLGGYGFDATIGQVITIDILLFLPYYLVAAIMLRSLAARLALYHTMRRQIVVPEYSPPEVLTPAEAGLLIDNDFTFNEIAATLKDLELRGHITIVEQNGELQIAPANTQGLDGGEQLFVRELLWPNNSFTTRAADSGTRLMQASEHLASITRERLVADGQLPKNPRINRIIRAVLKTFFVVALAMQVLLTSGIIMGAHEVFSVKYPRYPMNSSEPLLEVIIIAIVLAIVVSGFKQPGLEDDKGLKNWRYVAGLKMYLEKAYKDRFYRDNKQIATQSDMRTFYPYAIAFGIEKRFTDKLKRALVL